MTASATERALLDFVGERITRDPEEFNSFSTLTGYASFTRRHALDHNYDEWANQRHIREALYDGRILRWAQERGFTEGETPTATVSAADLREGDLVRLVGEAWGGRAGREGTIERVDDAGRAWFDRESGDTTGASYVNDEEWGFELVRRASTEEQTPSLEEAIASGTYHPDLLPMMEKISAAAQEAGYCAEYDRMARVVGAPTRAEVRRLVRERDGGKYVVNATFTVTVPIEVEADSEENARRVARSAPLPGTEGLSGFEATLASWQGIRAAIAHVASTGTGSRNLEWSGLDRATVTEL